MNRIQIIQKEVEDFVSRLIIEKPELEIPGEQIVITIRTQPLKKGVSEIARPPLAIDFVNIEKIGLNTHAINVLKFHGVNFVCDLKEIPMAKLRKFRLCGWGTISNIRQRLWVHGITLPDAPPFTGELLKEDLAIPKSIIKKLAAINITRTSDLQEQPTRYLLDHGLCLVDILHINRRMIALGRTPLALA